MLQNKLSIILYNQIIKQLKRDINSIAYPIKFEKLYKNNILSINQKVNQLQFTIKAINQIKRILPTFIRYAQKHNLVIGLIVVLKTKRIVIKYRQ